MLPGRVVPTRWRAGPAALALTVLPALARAQGPTPSPPPNLGQDALDLYGRASVVQGSGARAVGMGGAFLARPDDATAASWNPAGLSYLRLPEVSLVAGHGSLEVHSFDADGFPNRDDTRSGSAPDFAAATYPLRLGQATGSLQVSYQRAISFDAERTIQDLATRQVRRISTSGGFDVVALGSGLQLTRSLRVGLTLNRWLNGYQQELDRTISNRPSRQTAAFDIAAWNLNLGLIWSPAEGVNLGAVYKTAFTADVTLARTRTDFNPDGSLANSNSYESDAVRLDFPSAFGLGASWRPSSPLTLSADYTRTNWSEGRIRNFFTLPLAGPPIVYPELPYPSLEAEQTDTQQLRVGVEYVVIRSRLKWPLRGGYFADRQYFLDYGGSAPTLHGVTAGTGLIVGRFLLDFSYLHQWGSYLQPPPAESEDPRPQRQEVKADRILVSLIYRHRRAP